MEVCGTHTVAIFRHGIRQLLPPSIQLISGPGCPVCVTATEDIDQAIKLAQIPGVIVTSFGDLLRVPGSNSSLQQERAAGADVRIVYSTFDALKLARDNPARKVVFLAIGFETTAPTIAAAVAEADRLDLKNFLYPGRPQTAAAGAGGPAGHGGAEPSGVHLSGACDHHYRHGGL